MKQRLSIIIAFVLLITAIVTLECQLRCTQMELQGSAEVGNQLCLAIQRLTARQQAVQKMPIRGSVNKIVALPHQP
jgi:hypothetical protein